MKILVMAYMAIILVFTGYCTWLLHVVEQEAIALQETKRDTTVYGVLSSTCFDSKKIVHYNRSFQIVRVSFLDPWDKFLLLYPKTPK